MLNYSGTNILPPLVIECPECGEQYLVSQNTQPSEEAMLFSDGFFSDENNWRTPYIIGCVTCELGFFPAAGKLIATPNRDEFNEKWSHLKKASPPTAGALVLELRVRKNLNIDQEIAIRTELWYAVNHTTKGQELLSKNEKFKAFCIQSLNKLETLIQPVDTYNILLKAEINRQTGNFEKCLDILTSHQSQHAKQIIAQAIKKNKALFPLTILS